jgi:hypothetical protein
MCPAAQVHSTATQMDLEWMPMRYTHLFTDDDGAARFVDVEVASASTRPLLTLTEAFPVSAMRFATANPGCQKDQAPESRRNWILCLTGSVQITASGETRTFLPGDLLLAEDVVGYGHASFSPDGFTAAVIAL